MAVEPRYLTPIAGLADGLDRSRSERFIEKILSLFQKYQGIVIRISVKRFSPFRMLNETGLPASKGSVKEKPRN